MIDIIIFSFIAQAYATDVCSPKTQEECIDSDTCDISSCFSNQWRGDWSTGSLDSWNLVSAGYGRKNRKYGWFQDELVMRVSYPANSSIPSRDPVGGTGFYASPANLTGIKNILLEYQGGKLPGIYGGHKGCSGGRSTKNCFSTRLMWRKDGYGEAYMYVDREAQASDFCQDSSTCRYNGKYGISLSRGSFAFAAGRWTSVRQLIKLNSFNDQGIYQTDGEFRLYIDGEEKINLENFVYRTHDFEAVGLDFATFFGGSKPHYRTKKDEFTFFKDVAISY